MCVCCHFLQLNYVWTIALTTGSIVVTCEHQSARQKCNSAGCGFIYTRTSRHVAHVAAESWAYVMEMRLTLVDAADVGLIFCIA